MTPAIRNIPDHYQGNTFQAIQFTIKENGAAIPLTGAAIKMVFKNDTKTGSLKKSFEIGTGLTVTNAVAGVFLLDSFLNDWVSGTYFYDVTITLSSGFVGTYVIGFLEINQKGKDE